jgi:predicted nucleotidyltransferase
MAIAVITGNDRNKAVMSNIFQTNLLDELYIQRGLRLERERQSLLSKTIQWLNEFGDRHGINKAYIFGSVTQPQRFHEGSDVDIAVEEIQPDDLFAVIGFLSEAIARDVDVIVLSRCHFAEQIRRSGILWIKEN